MQSKPYPGALGVILHAPRANLGSVKHVTRNNDRIETPVIDYTDILFDV